jgi:hypothetical protein
MRRAMGAATALALPLVLVLKHRRRRHKDPQCTTLALSTEAWQQRTATSRSMQP